MGNFGLRALRRALIGSIAVHRADLWDYFYHATIAFGFAAKALGDDEPFVTIEDFADKFACVSGKGYQPKEWNET